MPFYEVKTKGEEKPRVVEADNPAGAMKHAAESMFTIGKPMKTSDVVAFMSGGGKIEKAGEAAAAPAADGDASAGEGETKPAAPTNAATK